MQPVAEPLAHPERDEIELARVLHALSDPVRLRIVAAIANGGECAMSAIEVPVAKSTCTHHFKVLRDAGVLAQRQVGTARMNTLRREDLDARFPGLLDTVLNSVDA
jgi:DNA-binding transcriptional ArsR family regulator